MAIIWRDEYRRGDAANPGITLDPPPDAITITRVEQQRDGNWHVWYAPVTDAMAEARDHPGRTITR